MDDADAVLAFCDSYGALLTERQVEHILHPRLRILEQPYDLAPRLFSICQLCKEYKHLLTGQRLADVCKEAADQNWTLQAHPASSTTTMPTAPMRACACTDVRYRGDQHTGNLACL